MLKTRTKLISSISIDLLLINTALFLTLCTIKFLNLSFAQQIEISGESGRNLLAIIAAVTVIRITISLAFQCHKQIWHFASVYEFTLLTTAIGISTVLLIPTLLIITNSIAKQTSISDIVAFQLIDGFYNFILTNGFKFSSRLSEEWGKNQVGIPRKHVLIIGAEELGVNVLRSIRKNPDKGYLPIGFIDDNREKVGKRIHGLDILGTTRDLTYIVRRRQVDTVIIAMPNAAGTKIREIIHFCEQKGCTFKIMPSIDEILSGDVSISQIRNVQVEDLLNRQTAQIDLAEVSESLTGKRVMVTGAGGSIGSELCRQISQFKPEQLILYARGENSLYHIEHELAEIHSDLNRTTIIGDIRDRLKVFRIIDRYQPQIIFHAAAHKHVTFMELNPDEAVKNNILGTKNLVDAAVHHRVESFILVSSDKAVNPSSVMGASKRVTEKLIESKAYHNGTKFVAVRFGNVIDSRGSVLPKFKRQIEKGGPVTVTHRDVIRYFMTIPESVQLLLQAGAMGNGGEIFILDMGDPIKILDLACDLIRLSGLEVERDIPIEFTGLEPGEKLYEELLTAEEGVTATKHQRIFVAHLEAIEEKRLLNQIQMLEDLANHLKADEIIRELQKIVPTYVPNRLFVNEPINTSDQKTKTEVINLSSARQI
ncbi:MAG: nucleoside-diphosphate sugar epimerase/dehydratase [Candidatus Poribacteria bacterium]|nr:nucleoside-diphosphate sugar epimerase/dehydratase [Candidatus Poribacteria bacterium]